MDEFGCDYKCRTVGDSLIKYNIPGDWCAEFDAHDGVYPIIIIQVDQIISVPAMMDLKLKTIENPNDEYAGCIVCSREKSIHFKIDRMSDLQKVLEKMQI